MHHRPVGPPLSIRLTGALSRSVHRTRTALRGRIGRLTLGAVLCAVMTALLLAVPVVSGVGNSGADLDASSSAARTPGPAVIMGLDGGEVSSSTLAGTTAGSGSAARTEQPSAASGTTGAAPAETSSAPAPEAPTPSQTVEPAPRPPVAAAAPLDPEPARTSTTKAAPTTTATTTPTATPAPAPGLSRQVLTLVNAARATAGCAPLEADAGLAGVARAHSEDMRDRDFFDHVNPDGLDPIDRAAAAGQTDARAENIASGQSGAAEVMDGWMNDSDDRANILNCELRTLGVGVAEGPGGPWWTQLFGV